MFLDKLRSDTAALHQQLERNPISRRLLDSQVTVEDYTTYLSRLYGFVSVFEEAMYPQLDEIFPGMEAKRKAGLIASDLVLLGCDVGNIPLVDEQQLRADYPTRAEAAGGFYVLEGSTLGGMVIYKHLHEQLGEQVEGKAQYFTVYGSQTGPNWRIFLDRFLAVAETLDGEAIIEGARRTFGRLDSWMGAA